MVVSAEEVKRGIKCWMKTDGEIRGRVREPSEKARRALMDGGQGRFIDTTTKLIYCGAEALLIMLLFIINDGMSNNYAVMESFITGEVRQRAFDTCCDFFFLIKSFGIRRLYCI